ncbi:MAG: tRNA (adenosine(37)-N6)-threonylcarbamoyltransferase complex ATPase subunit type 1 TsaE [Erysipelotrichaceae bacterium]|nr:tRNA (adenosine(37)-N6)-threonylcarbamoyltransferase complex ATPase subunit type 1 TsaE [Erysipelotrichaceae bacterium]
MRKRIQIHSLEETKQLAEKLALFIKPGYLITMLGDLGAGKTTFTKYLGQALGVKKTINSPTFTILKEYQGKFPIYHIDAYRLEGMEQDLGLEDIVEGDGLCIVEWPSFLEYCLPKERIEIEIRRSSEEGRDVYIRVIGDKYAAIEENIV